MKHTWESITFTVPAMSVDVLTKDKRTGKQVKKRDEQGVVITSEKIIPKERPRFSVKKINTKQGTKFVGHARSGERTTNFESWIRRKFFEKYPGNCGVYVKKKAVAVHSTFLGCRWYSEEQPCTRYRKGTDFLDCQVCRYRRKNLSLVLGVFLKDERHLDLDNVVKVVLDALEKVCFYNDSQFISKQVYLIPNASKERLDINLSVSPVVLAHGSLIGAYSLKNLSVKEASDYVTRLGQAVPCGYAEKDVVSDFIRYLARCDKRKYLKDVVEPLFSDTGPFCSGSKEEAMRVFYQS